MTEMTYAFKKGKYVICKDDVYFALTYVQVFEMLGLLFRIILRRNTNEET